MQNFGIFWPVLAILKELTHSLVNFLQAKILRWCTEIHKYKVCYRVLYGNFFNFFLCFNAKIMVHFSHQEMVKKGPYFTAGLLDSGN